MSDRFELSGVVHLVRPVGERVSELESLRTALSRVPDRALFFHTRARWLHRPESDELPPDDVSAWVGGVIQDREVAERLSYAADLAGESAAALRVAWLAVLDTVPERARNTHAAPPGGEFVFLACESVRVPSGRAVADATELMRSLDEADPSVWFWHLIEEPWEHPGHAPLLRWLESRGETGLAERFESVMRSGRPLAEMRRSLMRRWRWSGLGGRVAAAAGQSAIERRRAGREAVVSLTRRLHRKETP
ncbi:MAG: DUF5752 family protein [Candidatus Eisenbacteria bacterium]